ncbi:MAG: glycosyltransferase family 39 protein [Bacteroidetes bacterium]|nr:glycosyltransferase family 39 protein [Bacteroidota bacterium]MCL5027190.1 glycosyltransferase family 39 protein [Chloroflexota bacterium]
MPRLGLGLLVGAYLGLAALYAVNVPPWNSPDEPAHYNYTRQLAEQRTFPVLAAGDYDFALLERLKAARFPLSEPVDAIRYEGHQPPLFYILATPVYWATAGLTLPQRVVALRLLSAIFGALVLVVAYATVSRVLGQGMGLAAAGFIAFVPMYVFIGASVNNDALSVLMLSAILWALVGILLPDTQPSGWRRSIQEHPYWLVGALLGLALLTKTTAYIAVGIVAAVALVPQSRERWRSATLWRGVRRLTVAYGVAAAISGWWFIRNAWVYGNLDILAWQRHDQVVVGQPLTGAFDLEAVRNLFLVTFRSFWAQFGWMGVLVDSRIYLLIGALSILAAAGLCWWVAGLWLGRERLSRGQWLALSVLLGSALLTVAGLVQYNLTFIQAQGRYLFTAMVPIAAFYCLGLRSLVPRPYRGIVFAAVFAGMALLDVVCLFRFVIPDLRP